MKKTLLMMLFLTAIAYAEQAPKSLKATVNVLAQVGGTTHSVTLSWVAPTSGGTVTSYNIWRSTAAGICKFSLVSTTQTAPTGCTKVGNTTALTLVDSSSAVQAENSTFFYVQTSVGPGGESANSNEASATIPFLGPQPPTQNAPVPK